MGKIHGLEPGLPDYENDALAHLKRILASKWDFVIMQAEEQLKVTKDRKKGDRIINDSQEKAYWRVYKPPPGYNTLVENPPVPLREQKMRARRNNKEMLKHEIQFMGKYHDVNRHKTSKVADDLLEYTDTFVEWDPLLLGCGPSNPWMTDDTTYWEINKPIPDVPTEKRVRKWAISLEDIVMDPLGIQELLAYMKKEYSHENLRFWLAVQELKRGPGSEAKIKKKVKEIYEEFLSKGAKAEINIDGKTMEETRIAMKSPSRNTYDKAAEHVYLLLLKKDCYPRFIRSDHYKNLLTSAINPGSSRKRIFNFPQIRKKISQNHPSNAQGTAGLGGPNASGINPDDFDIYGMDGGTLGSDDEKTPLNANNQETPRKRSGHVTSGRGNEACPWDSPGPGPGVGGAATTPSPNKDNNNLGRHPSTSDSKSGNIISSTNNKTSRASTSRPVILTNNPSSDSMTGMHSHTADLGQVELDLDLATSGGGQSSTSSSTRKKSSSAILSGSGEEEIVVKKTSKSDDNAAAIEVASASEVFTNVETSELVTPFQCKENKGKDGGGAPGAEGVEGAVEESAGASAGENGCNWISSQEVCPWEDEENCKKENHPPFVKTYATLGFL